MSKPEFDVRIEQYELIREIEGAWTTEDFKKLLGEMDCPADESGTAEDQRELCLMCLQDREPVEAAGLVLKHRLEGQLSAGQITNTAIEMPDEKLWQHFADQSLHEELFHVASLMYAAFPQTYFEPDGVRLSIEIKPGNQDAKQILQQPLHESFVARLLADGMDGSSILHRLYADQLAGSSFPESPTIIWIIKPGDTTDQKTTVEIISSSHWLDVLANVKSFSSAALPDSAAVTQ